MITRDEFTEDHHAILQAAMDCGFLPITGDGRLFRVTDEDLVNFFVSTVAVAFEHANSERTLP